VLWVAVVFLLLPLFLERVEERLHFLTFGLFGALSMLLFRPRYAFMMSVVFSGADELLQYFLTDRVGDWRDVGMNSLASLSAGMFVWVSMIKPAATKFAVDKPGIDDS
jgi:VanZ family protein